MPIPQGLIVYRASRHQGSYPINTKHRYYSNKISLSTEMLKLNQSRAAQRKYQRQITKMMKITKMVRCLTLFLEASDLKKTQIVRYFSKLRRVKKCTIHFGQKAQSSSETITVIKRVFKILKCLEHIEMNQLGWLQKDTRIFQTLIRQRSLQKLVINPLYYYAKNLKSFMELSKKASRKKAWPRLKSLSIHLLASEKHDTYTESPGSLNNLLNFLKNFKSRCEPLYKCSHFQLILPQPVTFPHLVNTNPSRKEAVAFDGILKMNLPFTHISVYQGTHIKGLYQMAESLNVLRSFNLQLSDKLSDFLKMDSLSRFCSLQELNLVVDCTYGPNESLEGHFSYFTIAKLQNMTNLRSLSLSFNGDRYGTNDLLRAALSKLSELTHLKLLFSNTKRISWFWLKEVFQSISKMKRLKGLSLDFEAWDREDSSRNFQSLCQAVGRLTQLSSFRLFIRQSEYIKEQEISLLASHLSKLTILESLLLHIGELTELQLKANAFVVLMDSIVKNLRILSDLDLDFRNFQVTEKCSELVYEAIHQMKCLNKVKLMIRCQISQGINMGILEAQVNKRMRGSIECDLFR